jgi:NADH:ubiquinone oxidoreductase subunit 5 (subunit L)/multisubunit Na+/H+ antiporter MnhA subunit
LITASPDRSHAYWILFWLAVTAACLNTFAMTRWWMLTFGGRPRDRRLYNHAREAPTLLWPMAILAVMTVIAGGSLGVEEILSSSIVEARESARRVAESSYPQRQSSARLLFAAAWPTEESEDAPPTIMSDVTGPATLVDKALQAGAVLSRRWLGFALAVGLALAAAIYVPGPRVSERLLKIPPVRWVHTWLRHRMYFDEFYDSLFATLTTGLADLLARFDRNVLRALSRMRLRG